MVSKQKLKEFIKDEIAGNKAYRKVGFNSLARDEHKHLLFLERKLKKMK